MYIITRSVVIKRHDPTRFATSTAEVAGRVQAAVESSESAREVFAKLPRANIVPHRTKKVRRTKVIYWEIQKGCFFDKDIIFGSPLVVRPLQENLDLQINHDETDCRIRVYLSSPTMPSRPCSEGGLKGSMKQTCHWNGR